MTPLAARAQIFAIKSLTALLLTALTLLLTLLLTDSLALFPGLRQILRSSQHALRLPLKLQAKANTLCSRELAPLSILP